MMIGTLVHLTFMMWRMLASIVRGCQGLVFERSANVKGLVRSIVLLNQTVARSPMEHKAHIEYCQFDVSISVCTYDDRNA